MMFRRCILLLLGVLGGILAATGLYISAEGILSEEAAPTACTVPPLHCEETLPQEGRIITLPTAVPGTALIAQRLSAYDGPFLEDGSDREVVGVAALLVYNGGSREIQSAQITLQFGQVHYRFCGENIPAGGMVVLLEQNTKPYRSDTPTGCTGWQVVSQAGPEIQNQITVADEKMGILSVTNLTDNTLNDICIYYKSWLSPPDIYVGGISYCINIPQLFPGQKLTVHPVHYAAGYSKVVSVTVEQTE